MSRLPILTPREVLNALKKAGFVEAHRHTKGSHVFLWHPERRVSTVVAVHAKDIPRPSLKTIPKQAEMSEDEFLKHL